MNRDVDTDLLLIDLNFVSQMAHMQAVCVSL